MDKSYLEAYDQKNVIELITNIGYNYISSEQYEELGKHRIKEVLLRGRAQEKLMDINSYEYKRTTRKFSKENINTAIDELDMSLTKGGIKVN